jgi:hypothetical protein
MAIRNRIVHPRYTRHPRYDRCDRCSAAAQMRALLPTGNELFFCGHHARRHEPRLREIGAELSLGS